MSITPAVRKQRMTKDELMKFMNWYFDNEDKLMNMTNGRVSQLYEKETNVKVSALVIKNNKNKWVRINSVGSSAKADDGKIVKKEFFHADEPSAEPSVAEPLTAAINEASAPSVSIESTDTATAEI